ncbi:hypothetical protein ACR3LR_09220 [Pantoea eucalypti]|uniref:hypothetical protein n=1 Tax=Pantoea eucalypti TaxID=470933 RepID=UPI003EE5DC0A
MSEVKRHSATGYGYNDPEGEFVYYENYAELERNFGVASRACEEAEHINCEWEKAMMAAIGEDGILSVTKAIAELQAQRDALAAENAALKSVFTTEEVPECVVDAFNETAIMDHDWNDTGERSWVENDTDVIRAVLEAIKPETPATDAYLNSVRAEGVEIFAKHCDESSGFIEPEDETLYTLMEEQARNFVAQLRAGKDGE